MGCGSSAKTAVVQPIKLNELDKHEEDYTGAGHGCRGDSAVSKGTTDSGVVMDGRLGPSLPGAVPRTLPPLAGSPGLLQQDGVPVERPGSNEILEQLLSQGIIPIGRPREGTGGAGEAYKIMLTDGEAPRRRPPARLESLRASREQNGPSIEAIDHKMRQAEERRKLREDELKTRLRTKSARVRAPALAPEETLRSPVLHLAGGPGSPEDDPDVPLGHAQVKEAPGGLVAAREQGRGAGRDRGGDGGGGRGRAGSADGEGRELLEEEEVQTGELLAALQELETDSTFQQVDLTEEGF